MFLVRFAFEQYFYVELIVTSWEKNMFLTLKIYMYIFFKVDTNRDKSFFMFIVSINECRFGRRSAMDTS